MKITVIIKTAYFNPTKYFFPGANSSGAIQARANPVINPSNAAKITTIMA